MSTTKMSEHCGAADVAETLRQTRDDVQATIQEAGAAASDLAHEKIEELRAVASEYYDTGRERAVQYTNDLETEIRRNPLRSLLIAAGAGVVVGLFLKRR